MLEKQIQEKEAAIAVKQEKLAKAFEYAGESVDMAKKEVLDHLGAKDASAAVAALNALNNELTDLGKQRDELTNLRNVKDKTDERAKTPRNAVPFGGEKKESQDSREFGEVIMGSEAVKRYRKEKVVGSSVETGFGLKELKTLFITSAGWSPESTRVPGLVIDAATRPIQILDIIPAARTEMAAVVYMEETTRTHAAAERAEGAAYAESEFALTQRSSTVRSIGDSIPVTDEQLEDVSAAQSYLNQRLMFGVRRRIDGQVVTGNGVAPNLTGLLNASGLQTQAKGSDPTPDAVYKALRLVRVTGRAFPNAAIFHPSDWQDIRLLRTADGQYIWGSPSEAGPERIWGIQVVQSDAITENTALVGDFANFCALYERRGMEVAVGYVGTQFTEGERTIRAGMRVAFVVYRGAAFCQVTGI